MLSAKLTTRGHYSFPEKESQGKREGREKMLDQEKFQRTHTKTNLSAKGKRRSLVPLPCPSILKWQFGSRQGYRAAGKQGTISCGIQGKSVCMPVHQLICLSVCPSIHPSRSLSSRLNQERGTDRWMYAQISPIFYRTSNPLGLLLIKERNSIKKS